MSRPPLLARLHSTLAALTDSEQKVAMAVRRDPQATVYASVTELAAAAGVGETTVLRFARKLGFQSYQAFKIELARDIFSEGSGETSHAGQPDNPDLLRRATENNQKVIVDTYRLLDLRTFTKAVEFLAAAREIHFYGVGHSGITAQDASRSFWRMGLPARAFLDAHFQLMDASRLTSLDAAVGLSVSGSTRDTIECLDVARSRGAHTIAITGYAQAPIARVADVVLVTATREMPLQAGSFTSKIGQLHMLDLLLRAVVQARPEAALKYQEETGRAISRRLY